MAMVDAAWRAAFARQAEDGAAEAAADELEVEADPEDTGADGDEVLAGPPVPGANPPAPDPEAVLPAPAPAREAEILGVVDQPAPPSGEAEIAPGADEIVSERTSRTKTFDNGDGSFTTETHVEPIHVRQQGEWVDIDPELEQTDDGTFVNGPALVDVELASDASADELVSVDTGEGSVAYGLEGADDVEAHVDGATAVYEDVLPGVDLELESVGSGLKETVVLESPSASSVLRFPLALQDVTASLDAAGGVVFESGDGEEVAVIPPGFMVDSAVGGGVRSDAVTYDIEGDGDDAVLVVTADRGWLDAPERVWPVRVDPTIVDRNPVDATYVKQTVTADHTGASELRVGLEAGKLTATYMRFQFGIPADSYVSAATLVAHNSYSVGGCSPRPVNVYRVTQSWTGSTMTSWPGASFDSDAVAASTFAHGGGPSCPANWAQWNVRDLVSDWVRGVHPNQGLTLRVPGASTSDANAGKRFTAWNTAYVRTTWSPWGAAYNVAGTDWNQGIYPRANRSGRWRVQVRNLGSETWPANSDDIMLGARVYAGSATSGTILAQSRTRMPENVSSGEVVQVAATVPARPPGTYTVVWEMLKEGDFWFSTHGSVPGAGIGFQVFHETPQITGSTPRSGHTMISRSPQLRIDANDPDEYPNADLQYFFRICPGPDQPSHFPSSGPGCQSSGWQSSKVWTPPAALPAWNEAGYWWGYVRDGQAALEPRFAEPSVVIPAGKQEFPLGRIGDVSATASDGGVDLATGSYRAVATDASVGWGSATFAVNRTYHSIAYRETGAMGRGWSSIFDLRLVIDPQYPNPVSMQVRRADGRHEWWYRDPVASGATEHVYKGPMGETDTLTWDVVEARYVLRTADRTEYRFNGVGRLDEITHPGRPTIRFERTSPFSDVPFVVEVGASTFDLGWSGGRLRTVRLSADPAVAWTYGYSPDDSHLVEVCDPRPTGERGCHTYTYQDYDSWGDGVGPLETASVAGTTYLRLHHTESGEPVVVWRRDGEGHQWDYSAATEACPAPEDDALCRVATVDQPDDPDDRDSGEPTPVALVYTFDRWNRLMSRRSESAHVFRWTYDQLGYVFQEIDENGLARGFWRDATGHLVGTSTTRDGTAWTGTWPTTWYSYPSGLRRSDPRWGLPTKMWDPRVSSNRVDVNATLMTYDADGRILTRRSPIVPDAPAGRTETYTYVDGATGDGQLASYTDPAGRVTGYEYVGGQLTTIIQPSGLRIRFDYTDEGWVETRTEDSATRPDVVTTYGYDAAGDVVSVTGPPATNLVSTVTSAETVTRSYDQARRLTAETRSSSGTEADRTTTWEDFDGNGRPTRRVDPDGGVTTTSWNWRGQPRQVDTPESTRSRWYYTRTGQVHRGYESDLLTPGPTSLVVANVWDPAGRLHRTVDESGSITSYTYWDDGLVKQSRISNYRLAPTDPTHAWIIEDADYDLAGNKVWSVTRNGEQLAEHTYDLTNALVSTSGDNRAASYDYRPDGRIERVRVYDVDDEDVTVYGYGPAPTADLAWIAEEAGGGAPPRITDYEWDDRGLLTSTTVGNRRIDHTYDALGREVLTTGPEVVAEGYGEAPTTVRPETRYGYNAFGERTHREEPDGRTSTVDHDALGRPVTLTAPGYAPSPGSTLTPSTTITYDDEGRTRTVFDDLRGTTSTEVTDHRGRTVTRTGPTFGAPGTGGQTTYQWSDGRLTGVIGPEGAVEQYGYDSVGNRLWSTQHERYGTPGTYRTDYTYDDQFDLVRVQPPVGGPFTFDHDSDGQVNRTTAPDSGGGVISERIWRDHAGRVVRTSDSLDRRTDIDYDGLGNITAVRDYDDITLVRTRQYEYSAYGELLSETTPGPNPGSGPVTTTYGRDGAGRVTTITQPGGVTTSQGYDAVGRRVRSTDGNGNDTWFTYTPWDDLASVIDPSTPSHPAVADRTWSHTYAAPGLVATSTAPGGVTRTADHDALGNLVAETGTGGDADTSRTLTWDLAGRPTSVSGPGGATTLDWDDRGNLIATAGAMGSSQLTYDGAGRMTGRTDDGATSTFTYWPSGLLKTATGSRSTATATYSYDAAGQLAATTFGSGTTRSFGYDVLGNPVSDTLSTGSTVLASQTWAWAPDGAHLASTTTGPATVAGAGTESYTYDTAGRLVSTARPGSTIATTWDGAGNRLTNGTASATYDQRNRVTTATEGPATTTYTWTARGTLDATTGPSGSTDYRFDAFDRLVEETTPTASDTYQWDGLDRLAAVDGNPLAYAGLERDPVATDTGQRYERNPDGSPRAVALSSAPARFLRENHRGDVTATFTPGATSLPSSAGYSPFGASTGAGSGQPQAGYQGDWTSASGIVHMDARFYDPDTGTFLSRDDWNLTGTAASTNRYTYGAANPTTVTDPTGHDPAYGDCKPDPRSIQSRGFDHCDRPPYKPPPRPPSCLGCNPPPPPPPPPPCGSRCNPTPPPAPDRPTSPSEPPPPSRPPRPQRPWWSSVQPQVPSPPGHLVPPPSTGKPTIEAVTPTYAATTAPTVDYVPDVSPVPPATNLDIDPGDPMAQADFADIAPGDPTPRIELASTSTGTTGLIGPPLWDILKEPPRSGVLAFAAARQARDRYLAAEAIEDSQAEDRRRDREEEEAHPAPDNGATLPTDVVLDAVEEFLGEGYVEESPGRFVSKDRKRQVRMQEGDVTGAHGGGPHVNFERREWDENTGRGRIVENRHIYFWDD
ncbi:MAG TPA: DNRLRE domain-containing protein [Iamia sp.]|nr:DNRLRE domain-containing protein [Iamia sp.]